MTGHDSRRSCGRSSALRLPTRRDGKEFCGRLGRMPLAQRRLPYHHFFDRAVGAAGAVELVESCHVLVRQLEVEDLTVLGEALAVRRLRDDRDLALEAPAEQHLRRRAPCPSRCAMQFAVSLERWRPEPSGL
jgi:hypothetical protein